MNFDFNLDLGQWIVIALSAFLFIWYFTASSLNRRRGIEIYRWLYRGLGELGKMSNAEWIGSSNMGARLVVRKAAKPFRNVETRYLLEPREFLPYWLFSRLRGKRDEVVIQITLRNNPKANFEITSHEIEHLIYDPLAGDKDSHTNTDPEEIHLKKVLGTFLAEFGSTVENVVVQREAPHLTIHARIKPLLRSSAESYFRTLLTLFQDS